MKKFYIYFVAGIFFSLPFGESGRGVAQNLNVTLSDTRTYSGQALSNICGWKDPQDGKEYALVGAEDGLSIVDVTNPTNVFEVVQISGPTCNWREIKTIGNYAYITDECGTIGLQIVDLTNLPLTTLPTATWSPTINTEQLNTIHALHADGGKVYLYGSDVGNGGCIIADVTTNPMAPVYLGKYDPRYVHDGYVRNDTLYAGHIYDGECAIVDVSNPNNQIPLATFNTPTNFTHNTWLSADSRYCFTTDENNDSYLGAFDISNLGNITEVDRIQSNPGSNSVVHNTHIVQKNGVDYAVTSWYKDGFTIVDCSRPHNMVQVGNYDTAPTSSGSGMSNCWGVYPFLPSGTIVASDMSNGLFVCSPTYVRASYLEGVVYNCATTNPLSGVQVQIINPPAYSVSSSSDMTDALGAYGVGVVTAGTYTVTFSKQAYVSQTFTVTVSSGNVTTLNVNLCTQTPPFSYTGNVFDNATSVGIAGADIHMQDNTLIWDTITDANGNFTIPAMLSGSYDIIVGKWGYITKCFSGQNITSLSSPLSVGLDAGIYDDFSFDWGWAVSGAATNSWEMGEPVGTTHNSNPSNPDFDDATDCRDQAYVTDNGGGSASDHDVDPPGYTILTSPSFDPTSYTDAYLSYSRWFYNGMLNANPPNDTMDILMSNGSTTVLVERIKNNTPGNGTWVNKKYQIASLLTPTATMQVSVKTSDASPASVVEGAFDKFFVYDSATVAVNNISSTNVNVSVNPNPFSETATLQITSATGGTNYEVRIYNMFGREILNETIRNSPLFVIRRGALANGMYFYKITFSENEIASGKLMIE